MCCEETPVFEGVEVVSQMAVSRSIRRIEIRLAELAAVATVFASIAAPAWSAKILDARVGVHDEYTRIVFELDAPAGYQIEHNEPVPGISELVVSLDASATPMDLTAPDSDLVDGIQIQSDGDRSVVRIQLSTPDVRLKEMILTKPPRIVLDMMPVEPEPVVSKPKPVAAVSKKPAPAASKKPAPVVSKPAPVAEKAPDKAPSRATSAPTKIVDTAPAAPAPGKAAATRGELATEKSPLLAMASRSSASTVPAPAKSNSLAPAGNESVALVKSDGLAPGKGDPLVNKSQPGARKEPRPLPRAPRKLPPIPAAAPAADSFGIMGLDMTTLGAAAVGLVGLVASGALMLRRRGRGHGTEDGFDSPRGDGDPFAGFDDPSQHTPMSQMLAGDDATRPMMDDAPIAKGSKLPETSVVPKPVDPGAAEPGVATEPDMGAGVAPQAGSDTAELGSRLAAAESKLDGALEAAERMERKIAAQTEELRVQRAAIARTQRAVRNLSRSEEAGPSD